MNWQAWLNMATLRLSQTASLSPKLDAQILLSAVTGCTRTEQVAFGETPLTAAELAKLAHLLMRRECGEPVAYLTGEREFWSLPLSVSPAALIPRPDTECLVRQGLAHLPAGACEILDLGTGTGAIALALASERPDCRVTAIDSESAALSLAIYNAKKLAIKNVRFFQGDWFSPVQGERFTLILSNPPYIDIDDPHLTGEIRFEPRSALIAGDAGMADLAAIIRLAPDYLEHAGWLLLEHGWQQHKAVQYLLHGMGFSAVTTCQDYAGNNRVTFGQWLG